MRPALLRIIHTVVACTAVLSIPSFAMLTLLAGSAATTVELPAVDDPIRGGFRVTSAREPAALAQAVTSRDDTSEEVVPTAWVFTSKGNPSPWQGGGSATTTTLSGPTTGTHTTAVTFTASVTGSNKNSPPALNVTFYDGSTNIGTVNLTVPGSGQTSTASLSIKLSAGTHTITVKYNGDYNDQPSTSKALTVKIS